MDMNTEVDSGIPGTVRTVLTNPAFFPPFPATSFRVWRIPYIGTPWYGVRACESPETPDQRRMHSRPRAVDSDVLESHLCILIPRVESQIFQSKRHTPAGRSSTLFIYYIFTDWFQDICDRP